MHVQKSNRKIRQILDDNLKNLLHNLMLMFVKKWVSIY